MLFSLCLVFPAFFLDACFLIKERKEGYRFGGRGGGENLGAVGVWEAVIKICMEKNLISVKKKH